MTAPSDRTTLKRLPERGHHDSATVNAIVDEALICHVGFVTSGSPRVIPTIHARIDDALYLHGSAASHMLRTLKTGIEVSVAITHIDGLVMARSPFHHSMNYRSVVVFGTAVEVTDAAEKSRALDAFVNRMAPGRLTHVRKSTDKEIKATLVLRLGLAEASAKIRTGGPVDDEEDYELPIWAGVVPLGVSSGAPEADPRNLNDVETPDHIETWTLPGHV